MQWTDWKGKKVWKHEWLSHDRWCECSAGITPCGKSQATNAIKHYFGLEI